MATLRCPPPKIITTSGDRSPLSKMAKWVEIQTHRVTPTGRRSGRPRPTRIIRQAIPSRVEPVGKFCGASWVLTVINQTPTRSRARARGLSEGFPVTRVTWSRRFLRSRMRLRVDQGGFLELRVGCSRNCARGSECASNQAYRFDVAPVRRRVGEPL